MGGANYCDGKGNSYFASQGTCPSGCGSSLIFDAYCYRCDVGEGDCDWDVDCMCTLTCGYNNCKEDGKAGVDWADDDDCCVNATNNLK